MVGTHHQCAPGCPRSIQIALGCVEGGAQQYAQQIVRVCLRQTNGRHAQAIDCAPKNDISLLVGDKSFVLQRGQCLSDSEAGQQAQAF